MNAASLPPQPGLVDAEQRLAMDVPCMGCGYNLRSLAAGGLCPECGKPIPPSLELFARRLSFGDPAWLLEVCRGLTWLLVALGILVVLTFVVPVILNILFVVTAPAAAFGRFGPGMAVIILQWVSQLLALGIGVFALVKVTTPEPQQATPPRGDRARRVTRWMLVALPVSVLYGFVCALVMLPYMPGPTATPAAAMRSMANMMTWMPWLTLVGFVMMLPYYVLPLSFLTYLRILLERIPSRSLVALARFEFWGSLVIFVFFTTASVVAVFMLPPFFRTLAAVMPTTVPAAVTTTAPAFGSRLPGSSTSGSFSYSYNYGDPNGPTLRVVDPNGRVTVTTLPAKGMPATLPVGLTTLPAAPLPPPAAIAFGMAAGCMSLIGVCGGLVLLAGGVILIIGAAIALRRVAAGLQPAGMVR